jgi:hypothetical protein
LHQDAADHAAPTYETYVHDFIPFEWKLPRIFARSDRAGKMGGHNGRSALRDRFRGNCFDGNGELDRTGDILTPGCKQVGTEAMGDAVVAAL